MDAADGIVSVPPEEIVAEKQALLSKLHSFEKKDESIVSKETTPEADKKTPIIEPPKPPPKKIEVIKDTTYKLCNVIYRVVGTAIRKLKKKQV